MLDQPNHTRRLFLASRGRLRGGLGQRPRRRSPRRDRRMTMGPVPISIELISQIAAELRELDARAIAAKSVDEIRAIEVRMRELAKLAGIDLSNLKPVG